MPWIIAKKVEMTRIVKGDKFIPITLLEVPVLKVVWIKTVLKDWYNSILVWVLKEKKDLKLKKDNKFLSFNDFKIIKEFNLEEKDLEKFKVWDDISLDILEWVKEISLTWKSKWKWIRSCSPHNRFKSGYWGRNPPMLK